MTPRRKAEKAIIDAVKRCTGRLPKEVAEALQAYRDTWKRTPKLDKRGLPKRETLLQYDERVLWPLYSEYIRRKWADVDGMCRCCTCDKVDYWKNMHAGHWLTRAFIPTKYDDRNVHPQCPACNAGWKNRKGSTHDSRHEAFIAKMYGDHVPEELRRKAKMRSGRTRNSVNNQIYHYKEILKRMA